MSCVPCQKPQINFSNSIDRQKRKLQFWRTAKRFAKSNYSGFKMCFLVFCNQIISSLWDISSRKLCAKNTHEAASFWSIRALLQRQLLERIFSTYQALKWDWFDLLVDKFEVCLTTAKYGTSTTIPCCIAHCARVLSILHTFVKGNSGYF